MSSINSAINIHITLPETNMLGSHLVWRTHSIEVVCRMLYTYTPWKGIVYINICKTYTLHTCTCNIGEQQKVREWRYLSAATLWYRFPTTTLPSAISVLYQCIVHAVPYVQKEIFEWSVPTHVTWVRSKNKSISSPTLSSWKTKNNIPSHHRHSGGCIHSTHHSLAKLKKRNHRLEGHWIQPGIDMP